MSKNGKIALGVIVAVVIMTGMGLLRWSGMIYRLSDGERGWSAGAAVYQMLGWGTDAYREDLDRAYSPDDGEAGLTAIRGHKRFGRGFGRSRFGGGFGRLVSLAFLTGLGVFVYRRWRQNRPAAPAARA
ncbi:MAG: hypothetical protein GY832_22995 [Chloroflexi bacterium]|nr:hypothetical protein [Chloroflexota bacterium]